MEIKKIDITSSVIEKGLDTARSFLDKLVMPAVEETGLLLKDQVTLWRLKNQIAMLNRAKGYCEKNKIAPKTISMKLLCPLLDYASLEEDDVLHDKWAILLSNMVDSEQNIENHVFPYILSQLSRTEFLLLEAVFDEKYIKISHLKKELTAFRDIDHFDETKINAQHDLLMQQLNQLVLNSKDYTSKEVQILNQQIREIKRQKMMLENKEASIADQEARINRIKETAPFFKPTSFKDYEVSNVIRLGLVKEEKEFWADTHSLEIPNFGEEEIIKVDIDINVRSGTGYVLTMLGELFIEACKEKAEKA